MLVSTSVVSYSTPSSDVLKARGEPGVVANKIPPSISSRLLDYAREPGNLALPADLDSRALLLLLLTSTGSFASCRGTGPPLIGLRTTSHPSRLGSGRARMISCEAVTLIPTPELENVFVGNGFTRIDDISMLTPEAILDPRQARGCPRLDRHVHRVFKYARRTWRVVLKGGKLV